MRIKGIKFVQNNQEFVVAVLPVREIVGRCKVDVWSPENSDGYQRDITLTRAREFGRYMSKGGTSPTAVLINLRDANTVSEVAPGEFEVEDTATLWIVDGQHRIQGLSRLAEEDPRLLDVEMPVIMMRLGGRYPEAEQYLIINRTQKGVRADLAERILAQKAKREGATRVELGLGDTPLPASLSKDIVWRSRAVDIGDMLNQRTDSPLHGRVKLPNMRAEAATISQKSMSDSLKSLLRHEVFGNLTNEKLTNALINFWKAVQHLCPEPFEEVQETGKAVNYLLLRTAGPFVLHRVLTQLVLFCPRQDGRIQLTEEAFEDILARAGDLMSSEFWRATGDGTIGALGSSQKSFALAADLIMGNIGASQETTGDDFAVDV